MPLENKVWYLRHSRAFERVSGEALEGCEHLFTVTPRPRRTRLFEQGDPSGTIYFLKRGRVRLARVTPDGKEITVAVLHAGDLFGEEALFEIGERTTVATVIEDALVCTSRAETLFELISRYPVISLNIAKYLNEQRDEAVSTIEEIAYLKVPDRIVRLFERLAEEHGIREADGVRIDVRLTHADIASLIGSTRETVSLEIGRLLRAGRLTQRDRAFVLPLRAAI